MARAAWRKDRREAIRGVTREVDRWLLDTLCTDKRDPDYGWAIAVLRCGHMRAACYTALRKRSGTERLQCVTCLPSWMVHVREQERLQKKRLRATKALERIAKKERERRTP